MFNVSFSSVKEKDGFVARLRRTLAMLTPPARLVMDDHELMLMLSELRLAQWVTILWVRDNLSPFHCYHHVVKRTRCCQPLSCRDSLVNQIIFPSD